MEEDRQFRQYFGCGLIVAASLWMKLNKTGKLPKNGAIKHLLWALAFLKIYSNEITLTSMAKVDAKTWRPVVWSFIEAICALEEDVVSLFEPKF